LNPYVPVNEIHKGKKLPDTEEGLTTLGLQNYGVIITTNNDTKEH